MGKMMGKKMTIAGDLGSGKSSVARLIQAETGMEIYSTGKMQREIAAKYGMTTLELNKYSESHPEIDEEIDNLSRALGDRPESLIVDSRLAWFFIPHSFKIYLSVDPVVAAQRIMGDRHRKSEAYVDPESAKQQILERKRLENSRFLSLYGADCANMSNFNLVIDTTEVSPEMVAHTLIEAFRAWPGSS